MKRVFIVTGELSGDAVGAWYIKKLQATGQQAVYTGIVGDALERVGVQRYARFESLNVTGVVEIVCHLPGLIKKFFSLICHIIHGGYDEVIVVDFPGFNIKLITWLKRLRPGIKITYLSPPQLWCWGAWRVKKLKKYTDAIVVLYPHEVAWYAQRGCHVVWLGSCVYEALQAQCTGGMVAKEPILALLPGSRTAEVLRLLPIFLRVSGQLQQQFPELVCVLIQAPSIPSALVADIMQRENYGIDIHRFKIVTDQRAARDILTRSAVALSKPGTVTLQLAVLRVATVVAFVVPWLTYQLARLVVNVRYMALPNLLLDQEVYPECIQKNCTQENLVAKLSDLFKAYLSNDTQYTLMRDRLDKLERLLRNDNGQIY